MKGGGAMSSIAIIPARGGSTRRPRGYLRAFCGRPILEYSIGAALESQLFDEVVVSTEDAELAEAARACGAEVPFLRSAASSDDFEAMADMLFEVLSFYRERDQWFEMMCCIYPAAPFVTTEKLCSAEKAFRESGAEMLEAVIAFSYPPQQSLSLSDGRLVYNDPRHVRTRPQDLPTWYRDAEQFCFYQVPPFLRSMRFGKAQRGYSLSCAPFFLDEMEVQDIKSPADWHIAEWKYRMMRGAGK